MGRKPARRTSARSDKTKTVTASDAIEVAPTVPAVSASKEIDWGAYINSIVASAETVNEQKAAEETAFFVRPFTVSFPAEAYLQDTGCPQGDIDACTCMDDVDALFAIYKDKATKSQMASLRKRGMSEADIAKIKTKRVADAVLTKLKKDTPASAPQLDYIKVLYRRANITKPIPAGMCEEAASNLIIQLLNTTPATLAQLDELRRSRAGYDEKVVSYHLETT